MFYRLFINYLRLKLVRIVLTRLGGRLGTGKKGKNINFLSYVIDLIGASIFSSRKRSK